MIQITDNAKEQRIVPLFRLGFRPFFLFASIFSILAVGAWILNLSGMLHFTPYGGSLWWHSHEMVFGFAFAVIIGFLLTAIQNWTGVPGLRGWPLFMLFCSWALARVLLLWDQVPATVAILVDLSTPLLAGWFLWRSVYLAKQWRNLFFVPIMLLFALANFVMHWALLDSNMALASQAARTVVLLVTLVMCVMGGRVIPFFTARGTGTERPTAIATVEFLSLAPLWLFVVINLLQPWLGISEQYLTPLPLLAGFANLMRVISWRPWITLNVPLLWSLHGAYLFIASGLIAYGISMLAPAQLSITLSLHFLTVGAIGALILGMIARVSLGHTGRPLQVRSRIAVAFALILFAGLVRTLLPMLTPALTLLSYQLSGILWMLAYGIFAIEYWPILTRPRLDGRPG